MNWYKVESNIAPTVVDTVSSPTTVFVRDNVEQKKVKDENGNSQILFVYDERKLSKEEYALEIALKGSANIDFLMMLSDEMESDFDEEV